MKDLGSQIIVGLGGRNIPVTERWLECMLAIYTDYYQNETFWLSGGCIGNKCCEWPSFGELIKIGGGYRSNNIGGIKSPKLTKLSLYLRVTSRGNNLSNYYKNLALFLPPLFWYLVWMFGSGVVQSYFLGKTCLSVREFSSALVSSLTTIAA